jgi:hypothetical protein
LKRGSDFIWYGERNRRLDVYRPCPCGGCSKHHRGIGYLSSSDAKGRVFWVLIEDEEVFQRLALELKRLGLRHRTKP